MRHPSSAAGRDPVSDAGIVDERRAAALGGRSQPAWHDDAREVIAVRVAAVLLDNSPHW
jgi:hypothetical protein